MTQQLPKCIPNNSPIGLFLNPQRPQSNLFISRADLILRNIPYPKPTLNTITFQTKLQELFLSLPFQQLLHTPLIYSQTIDLYKQSSIDHQSHFNHFIKDFIYQVYTTTSNNYHQQHQQKQSNQSTATTSHHNHLLTFSTALFDLISTTIDSIITIDSFDYSFVTEIQYWLLFIIQFTPHFAFNLNSTTTPSSTTTTISHDITNPTTNNNNTSNHTSPTIFNTKFIQLLTKYLLLSLSTPYLTAYQFHLTAHISSPTIITETTTTPLNQLNDYLEQPFSLDECKTMFSNLFLSPDFLTHVIHIYAPHSTFHFNESDTISFLSTNPILSQYIRQDNNLSLSPITTQLFQSLQSLILQISNSSSTPSSSSLLDQFVIQSFQAAYPLSSIKSPSRTIISIDTCQNLPQIFIILFLTHFQSQSIQYTSSTTSIDNDHNPNNTMVDSDIDLLATQSHNPYRQSVFKLLLSYWVTAIRLFMHNYTQIIQHQLQPSSISSTQLSLISKSTSNSITSLYQFLKQFILKETPVQNNDMINNDHSTSITSTNLLHSILTSQQLLSSVLAIIPDGGYDRFSTQNIQQLIHNDNNHQEEILSTLEVDFMTSVMKQFVSHTQQFIMAPDNNTLSEHILHLSTIIQIFIQKGFLLSYSTIIPNDHPNLPLLEHEPLSILLLGLCYTLSSSTATTNSTTAQSPFSTIQFLQQILSYKLNNDLISSHHNLTNNNLQHNLLSNEYYFHTQIVPIYHLITPINTIQQSSSTSTPTLSLSKVLYTIIDSIINPTLESYSLSSHIRDLSNKLQHFNDTSTNSTSINIQHFDQCQFLFNIIIFFSLSSQRPKFLLETISPLISTFFIREQRLILSNPTISHFNQSQFTIPFTVSLYKQSTTMNNDDNNNQTSNDNNINDSTELDQPVSISNSTFTTHLSLIEYFIFSRCYDFLNISIDLILQLQQDYQQQQQSHHNQQEIEKCDNFFQFYSIRYNQSRLVTLLFCIESKINLSRVIKLLVSHSLDLLTIVTLTPLFPQLDNNNISNNSSLTSNPIHQSLLSYMIYHQLPTSTYIDLFDLFVKSTSSTIFTNQSHSILIPYPTTSTIMKLTKFITTFKTIHTILTSKDYHQYPFIYYLLYFNDGYNLVYKMYELYLHFQSICSDSFCQVEFYVDNNNHPTTHSQSLLTTIKSSLSYLTSQQSVTKIEMELKTNYLQLYKLISKLSIPNDYSLWINSLSTTNETTTISNLLSTPQLYYSNINTTNPMISTTPLHTLLSTLTPKNLTSIDAIQQLCSFDISTILTSFTDKTKLICYEPFPINTNSDSISNNDNTNVFNNDSNSTTSKSSSTTTTTTTTTTTITTTTTTTLNEEIYYRGYNIRDYLSSLTRSVVSQLTFLLDPQIQTPFHQIINLYEGNITTVTKDEFLTQQTIRDKMAQLENYLTILQNLSPTNDYNNNHYHIQPQLHNNNHSVSMGFDSKIDLNHVNLTSETIQEDNEEDEDAEIDSMKNNFQTNQSVPTFERHDDISTESTTTPPKKHSAIFTETKLDTFLYHNNKSLLPFLKNITTMESFSNFAIPLTSITTNDGIKQQQQSNEQQEQEEEQQQQSIQYINGPFIEESTLIESLSRLLPVSNLRIINDNGINRRITNTELYNYSDIVIGSVTYYEKNIFATNINVYSLYQVINNIYKQLYQLNCHNVQYQPIFFHNTNTIISSPQLQSELPQQFTNSNESKSTSFTLLQPKVKDTSLLLSTLSQLLPMEIYTYAIQQCLLSSNSLSRSQHANISPTTTQPQFDDESTLHQNHHHQSHSSTNAQSKRSLSQWFYTELSQLNKISTTIYNLIYTILTTFGKTTNSSLLILPHHLSSLYTCLIGCKCIQTLLEQQQQQQPTRQEQQFQQSTKQLILQSLHVCFDLINKNVSPQFYTFSNELISKQMKLYFQ